MCESSFNLPSCLTPRFYAQSTTSTYRSHRATVYFWLKPLRLTTSGLQLSQLPIHTGDTTCSTCRRSDRCGIDIIPVRLYRLYKQQKKYCLLRVNYCYYHLGIFQRNEKRRAPGAAATPATSRRSFLWLLQVNRK